MIIGCVVTHLNIYSNQALKVKYLCGKFEKWAIDEKKGLLYDDGNNSYDINEIRAIFFYKQLAKSQVGSKYEIASLKEHLAEKIESIRSPIITIDWGDKIEIIKKG